MTSRRPDPPVSGVAPTIAVTGEVITGTTAATTGNSTVHVGTVVPQRIGGRYELLGLLGSGGMGAVYRVRDTELDEVVALKMLHSDLANDAAMLARFRQEAKLARRVTHRCVARTFDIGEHEGEKFLTIEFVEGESLADRLARQGALSLGQVVSIVTEVCAGVGAAHAAGVVHRDLKPDNVLLGKDGRIVVTDFGIAHALAQAGRVTKTIGGVVGTPAYMAPEQVEGAPDLDARADVYAIGAMTYELLTGQRAWGGGEPFAVAAARLLQPPPDPRAIAPGLPEAVAEVVRKAMAKSRTERFQTVDDFSAALVQAAGAASAPSLSAPRPLAPARPSSPPPNDRAVAVLPFQNAGKEEDAYLADGLTEDLIDVLSMSRGLRVRPRGMVAHLRGVDRDPRDVGRELEVDVVVQGSVRRTPSGVRVNVRLIGVADGFQLWAKRFDRPTGEALELNDETAHAILEALALHAPQKKRAAPTDALAVDLFLRASHEHAKSWRDDLVRAIDLYDQALARAPNDPTILSASARARVRLAFFEPAQSPKLLALAQSEAERALAVAPDHGESWAALAAARFASGDGPGALQALSTCLAHAPGLAHAQDFMGRILLEVGGVQEAGVHLRTALSIDPSMLSPRWELARMYGLLGDWKASDALVDLPAPTTGARISKFLARLRYSIWRAEVHPELLQEWPPLGSEFGAIARTNEILEVVRTREMSDELRALIQEDASRAHARRRTLFLQLHAEIYAYVFEIDEALDAIASAVQGGLLDIVWMDLCPVLEPVRKDSRFLPFRAEVSARAQRVLAAHASGSAVLQRAGAAVRPIGG